MYGFNIHTRALAMQKVKNVKFYMDNNFVKFGECTYPFSHFFKNSYINPQRYIAEIQNRVYSLEAYASSKNLVPLFVTLSAPSEYHPLKQIPNRTGKKLKFAKNPKFNPINTPKTTAKYLSKCMQKITNSKHYRNIPKDQRCYFRVTEPHQDGTPHLHVMFFIPKDNLTAFSHSIQNKFPSPQTEIVDNVESPIKYLMKYIYKTLDDLRYGEDKLSDLTLWYIAHGICRIYTSRTLISLDVYRVLGGRYSMNQLTYMYKEKRLTVFLDPTTNRPIQIFDDYGQIWNKKIPIDVNYNHMRQEAKPMLKEKTKSYPITIDDHEYLYINGNIIDLENKPFNFSTAKDFQLLEHYNSLDIENVNFHHLGLVQNECIKRGLIKGNLQNVNDFNTNFNYLGA